MALGPQLGQGLRKHLERCPTPLAPHRWVSREPSRQGPPAATPLWTPESLRSSPWSSAETFVFAKPPWLDVDATPLLEGNGVVFGRRMAAKWHLKSI